MAGGGEWVGRETDWCLHETGGTGDHVLCDRPALFGHGGSWSGLDLVVGGTGEEGEQVIEKVGGIGGQGRERAVDHGGRRGT